MLFTGGGSRVTQPTPSTREYNPRESRSQGGGESGRGRAAPYRPMPGAGPSPAPQSPPAPGARPSPTPQITPTPGATPTGVGTQGGGGKPRSPRAQADVTAGGPVPTLVPPATARYGVTLTPAPMPAVEPDFGGGVVPKPPTPPYPAGGGGGGGARGFGGEGSKYDSVVIPSSPAPTPRVTYTPPYPAASLASPAPTRWVTYTPPYPAAGLASPTVSVVVNPTSPVATTGAEAGAAAATGTAAPQTAVPGTTAVAPPRTTAGVAAPPAGTPRSVDELTDYYARKLPGTGAEFVNWREVDSMWPGTFEEFDAWVDAFTREHGYPPWSGSFHPTEVLRENVAARDWGMRFMMRHGRPPTEEEYKSEWYANRFGLGPYDYDNPAFFGAPLGAGWGRFWARRWGPRGWGEPWNRRGRGGRRRGSPQQGGGGYEAITLPISGPGIGV